jgi:Holliday junction resolvase RusA-like endonuclease
MKIHFTVPAVPVPQPAKQHRIAKAKGRQFSIASTPTLHPVNAYKATVAHAASEAHKGPPLDGPIVAAFVFVLPRGGKPGWITAKRYPQWFAEWKAGRRVPYAVKKRHDRDNLLKSTQDAMSAVIADDGLIYAGPVEKWIAAWDEQPHVEITIETLDERETER